MTSHAHAPAPASGTFDPLQLCVFATVALLGWWAGPFAVAGFAALGLAGYVRARRAGLQRSRCVLRDTRLVIGYLAAVLAAAVVVAGSRVLDLAR
jgi:hypothetical protein